MRSTRLRLFTLLGVGVVVAACSDSHGVTSPTNLAGPAATRVLFPTPTAVNVVTRNVPLATSQSASAVIGLLGGQINLPGAGLTVVVPPLAVTASTLITVTAVAGAQVAYEFEPHGTQFLVPLIVTQSLSGTSASGGLFSSLYAGHFQNVLDLDQLNGTALISELLGTSINLWRNEVTFSVSHFSGYLIATGLNSPEGEGQP